MKRSTRSQRMGHTISRLIGIASEMKEADRPESPKVSDSAKETQDLSELHEQLRKERREKRQYQRMAEELNRKYLDSRRNKLANYSLKEIESELVRRQTLAREEPVISSDLKTLTRKGKS